MNTSRDTELVLAKLDELRQQIEQLRGLPATQQADRDVFWALDQLKRGQDDGPGEVLFAGCVALADETFEWQQGALTEDLLERDWSAQATELAALAHPVRLAILQNVLQGRRTTGELLDLPAMGTVGQLHHHLRQLVSAGWLHHTARGRYQVPGSRVVPLLVVLAAAAR